MSITKEFKLLDESQMTRFIDLIYAVSGIRIQTEKQTMLSNRIHRRLKARSLDNYDDYFHLLRKLPITDSEWDCFLQEVSTHETFMFRDQTHWTWFNEEFLPGIVEEVRAGSRTKTLRIWSAACSTGDEAHTIAVSIANVIPDHKSWDIQIVGTDIGIDAVQTAREGVFSARSVSLLPENMKKFYFMEIEPGTQWKASDEIRNMLSFRQHNLLEPFHEPAFDVVFLKNVLIYFDDASKTLALQHVLPKIRSGGALVTTGAEGHRKIPVDVGASTVLAVP